MFRFIDDEPQGSAPRQMTQTERNVLGIRLAEQLRSVADARYAGITVWVHEDGEHATIANIVDRPPLRTRISKIQERIAQGRHQ